jgi:hypothetical protein
MKKLLITATALLALSTLSAQAADKMSKAGVPAGTYCQVIEARWVSASQPLRRTSTRVRNLMSFPQTRGVNV